MKWQRSKVISKVEWVHRLEVNWFPWEGLRGATSRRLGSIQAIDFIEIKSILSTLLVLGSNSLDTWDVSDINDELQRKAAVTNNISRASTWVLLQRRFQRHAFRQFDNILGRWSSSVCIFCNYVNFNLIVFYVFKYSHYFELIHYILTKTYFILITSNLNFLLFELFLCRYTFIYIIPETLLKTNYIPGEIRYACQ